MAKILSFGSLNVDHVYHVSHMVQPGETISAKSLKLAKEKNQVDIIQKLMHTKGVESANLVEQTDDIGR